MKPYEDYKRIDSNNHFTPNMRYNPFGNKERNVCRNKHTTDNLSKPQCEPVIISGIHELRDYVLPKIAEYFLMCAMEGNAKRMFWKLAKMEILKQTEIKLIRCLKISYMEKLYTFFCHLFNTRNQEAIPRYIELLCSINDEMFWSMNLPTKLSMWFPNITSFVKLAQDSYDWLNHKADSCSIHFLPDSKESSYNAADADNPGRLSFKHRGHATYFWAAIIAFTITFIFLGSFHGFYGPSQLTQNFESDMGTQTKETSTFVSTGKPTSIDILSNLTYFQMDSQQILVSKPTLSPIQTNVSYWALQVSENNSKFKYTWKRMSDVNF